ncbi:hypothetical protein AB1Y20_012505 [Prymnesium parvum]|uniref:Uncharacterized protein n=1 Tax=Prymnesium parvum TaxID=97485 RepID=A0AB34IKU5_PRYPA
MAATSAQLPQSLPPVAGFAGFSTGPSSAFSTPSHQPPAGPLGPQLPQPPSFSVPPTHPLFGTQPSPQLSAFLSSVQTQVPRTAMEFASALSAVPAPPWYTAAALSSTSSRSPTAAPPAPDAPAADVLAFMTSGRLVCGHADRAAEVAEIWKCVCLDATLLGYQHDHPRAAYAKCTTYDVGVSRRPGRFDPCGQSLQRVLFRPSANQSLK